MKRVSFLIILSFFLIFPAQSFAKKALEDEIQDFTVAERAFQDKFYEFTRQQLEKFLEYYPRSEKFGEAKLLLGKTYLELGKSYEALKLFSEILKEGEFKGFRDQALYWSAEVHFRAKDFKTAKAFYQELIDHYPESSMFPYAVYSVAWCQEADLKFAEAETGYTQFILRFPTHPLTEEAAVRQVVCFSRQKKFEETLNACRAFLEKHPSSSMKGEIHYLRGEVLFEKEDFHSAIAAYEEALGEKEGEKPWRSLARLNEGWSYFKLKETEKALSLFKLLTQEKMVRDAAFFGMALSYRFQEKYEEALGTLEELLKNSPQKEWRVKALLE